MRLPNTLSRRQFLSLSGVTIASAGLASCATSTAEFRQQTTPYFRPVPGQVTITYQEPMATAWRGGPVDTGLPPQSAYYAEIYGPVFDGGFALPAIPYQQIDPRFYRQQVADPFGEAPGTIIVDTKDRFLYLVQPGGRAMRYGVGIGREGFAWSGRGVIQWKQKWPRWRPPNEMVARQPHLAEYSIANGGMAPGLNNPLGARAMYIFKNGQDTLYRLHGSPEWKSIGRAVSSGCVRLMNQDVIDLYDRVRVKSPILVV
ncbi:hypothetical protein BJF92_08120 [Rhizobium rhizosphaerae]|uniref:L,D-TPase catalytic domain-containing protein n=1 Tax=Xaviernesmea rhizosphaerae TaxID=1672749 RepID=A0A1Q9AK23_9HYPH|nr:L,D-transpeptidase family protein [Xaviernesmea rhizosphaerae]OLP55631.1 hypothetical protein BJF92_08120 [Xaviernesmea rhizosphaerae]